jgi:hypothetical protein
VSDAGGHAWSHSELLGLYEHVATRPSLRRYLDDTPEPPVLIYAQTPGTKKKRRPRRGAWSAKSLHEQQHRPWLTYIRPGEHLQLFVSNRKHDNEKTGNEETRTQHWPPPRSVTLADLRPERRWGPERKPTPYLLFGKPCTRWRVAESKPWLWTPAPPGHVWSSCGRWAGGRWWDHCSGYAPWSWDDEDDEHRASCRARGPRDAAGDFEYRWVGTPCSCDRCRERQGAVVGATWRSRNQDRHARQIERRWLGGLLPCEKREGRRARPDGSYYRIDSGQLLTLEPIPAENRRAYYRYIPIRPREGVKKHAGTTIIKCQDPAPSRDNPAKRWRAHMPDALVSEATTRGRWGYPDDDDEEITEWSAPALWADIDGDGAGEWKPPQLWADLASETSHLLTSAGSSSCKISDPGYARWLRDLARLPWVKVLRDPVLGKIEATVWRAKLIGKDVPPLASMLLDFPPERQWAPRLVHAVLTNACSGIEVTPSRFTSWGTMTPSELADADVPSYVDAAAVYWLFRNTKPGRGGGGRKGTLSACDTLLSPRLLAKALAAQRTKYGAIPDDGARAPGPPSDLCHHGYDWNTCWCCMSGLRTEWLDRIPKRWPVTIKKPSPPYRHEAGMQALDWDGALAANAIVAGLRWLVGLDRPTPKYKSPPAEHAWLRFEHEMKRRAAIALECLFDWVHEPEKQDSSVDGANSSHPIDMRAEQSGIHELDSLFDRAG